MATEGRRTTPPTASLATRSARSAPWPPLLFVLLLAAPLWWPVASGIGGALATIVQGAPLAGGGTLWPSARVSGLLLQGLALSSAVALAATAVGALCGWSLLLPLSRAQRWTLAALLAAVFCCGTVVHLIAWRSLFPGVNGGAAGWAMAIVTMALRYAPLSAALFAAGLASFERAELEAALCTGGGRALWAVARRRAARLAGLSVAAVGALVFAESELPPLVGVHVYAEEFLSQVAIESSTRTAMALGWPLMLVAAAGAWVLARVPRLRANAAGAVAWGWIGRWMHAPRRLRLVLPIVTLLLAALPLLLLIWGVVNSTGRWPAHAFSALAGSLGVALLASALACAWGWLLAAVLARVAPGAITPLSGLLWLTMLWPSALLGLAVAGWSAPSWAPPALPLVLAHALRVLPFATWVLLALRDAQPRAMHEQLRVLGARGWAVLWRVHAAAAAPGLAAAMLLCGGLSLAELTITVLTVPAGMETVILRLYNLMHYGDQRGVMMLALMQGLTVAALVLVALGWLRARVGND